MKRRRQLLIVEDEQATRELLRTELENDFVVRCVGNGEEALSALQKAKPDVVLLDVSLPGITGLEVLQQMSERMAELPLTIVCTADATIATAVEAVRHGAFDYLVKPFSMERIRKVLNAADLEAEGARTRRRDRRVSPPSKGLTAMLGEGSAIARIKGEIDKVADTRGTVLITGESGTGKELAARAIHELSGRSSGPYIRVNCAAIPETLLEAELFGYEKGAFTNAIARREGMFELAHGGTLLLDEISEIQPSMQAKLLRVLQEREFMRLGGKASIRVDVRVIATTNRDLKTEVREGRFKEDLYYRLNVLPLHIPPLRDRKEDIEQLSRFFVARTAEENGLDALDLTPDALKSLAAYPWPGNIRELENSLERSVILTENEVLDAPDLRLDDEEALRSRPQNYDDENMTLREMEKDLILRRLSFTGGNRTRAAKLLGISVRTLRNKINQYRQEGTTIPG